MRAGSGVLVTGVWGARLLGGVRVLVAGTGLACLLGAAALSGGSPQGSVPAALAQDGCAPRWTTAWHAAVQPAPAEPDLAGRTLRMTVTPQVTGTQVRIRVTNAFGATPLRIGAASVGRSAGAAGAEPGTLVPVTFAGGPAAVVVPGADLLSDPVPLAVRAGRALAVGLHLTEVPAVLARHAVALETSHLSGPGDAVLDPDAAAFGTPVDWWSVLTGVDVLAPRPVNAVVAVGDSITDGVGSAPGTGGRWTDALGRRLTAAGGPGAMAVLNAGIAANHLVDGGTGDPPLARFDRDVVRSGATDVVLHIGTNDVAAGRSAEEIVSGLVAYADRARSAGTRLVLTTITPSTAGAHGTPDAVAVREAVNAWVRTHSAAHAAGVADFAAAVADPADPARLAPAFDSGDGLHLSAAGYRALADALDPALLTGSPCLAAPDPVRALAPAP